jgi:hypothetical protein
MNPLALSAVGGFLFFSGGIVAAFLWKALLHISICG